MRVILVSIDGFAGFYWRDPGLAVPTLRRLASRGVVSTRMETVFPSTTWPCHVTLVTGTAPRTHGVVSNSILNRGTGQVEHLTGDPVYDAPALLRVPTVYDVAHAAGLRTAAIDWPATRGARSLDWSLPFFKDQSVFAAHTPPAVWAELESLRYPVERQAEWAQLPQRFFKDGMVATLAADVLRRHAPDLLLVHFLATDSFQHLWGPGSPEARWAIEYVDERLGLLLASLPDGALEKDTVVVVVSDHGFLPVAHDLRVNARLREIGLLRTEGRGPGTAGPARFVTNHGSGWVYLLGDSRPELGRDIAGELRKIEGVANVWTDEQFPELGLPTTRENALVGDLLLEAEPGFAFTGEAEGELVAPPHHLGTHGHLPSRPDNAAFFLAAGPGLASGVNLGPIRTRDVAPTIAHLLDVELPSAEGRVLSEILA